MRVQIRPDGVIDVTYDEVTYTVPEPVQAVQAVQASPKPEPKPEPTVQPKAAKPEPKATVVGAKPQDGRKRRQPKDATKSQDNKAAFEQIRALVSEGDWSEAIALAEGRGWVGEADRLRARAAKASTGSKSSEPKARAKQPTKAPKPKRQPKAEQPQLSVVDADSVGGGVDDTTFTKPDEVSSVEDVLKSARGSAMSAVSWGRRKAQPERIQAKLDEFTARLKLARAARSDAQQRDDVPAYEGQHALCVGFADICDRLADALAELEAELV